MIKTDQFEKAFQQFLIDESTRLAPAEAAGTAQAWIASLRLAWAAGAKWALNIPAGDDDGGKTD